jgi:hypothetical protein
MRKPSFAAGLLVLVAATVTVQAQSYTIKLKLDPDPGQSVVVRDSSKDTGSMKFVDPQGKLLFEEKGGTREAVYTETTLEKGEPFPAKYKRVYETANEAKGEDKAKPFSYQGRTVVFELKDGKHRVGVVGKPPLDDEDQKKLTQQANDHSEQALLVYYLAPKEAVKVGDSWKIDVKKIASGAKPAQINADKSSAEAKLVKVYTKDKKQFGVFEIKAQLAVEGIEDVMRFDPPLMETIELTADVVIDGSSTLGSISGSQKLKGTCKAYQGKNQLANVEADISATGREERSAEKEDPKGREVPAADFQAGKTEWKEFTSKEGKFTANFPETPKVDTKKDPKGNASTSTIATAEGGAIAYFVGFTELAPDAAKNDPQVTLENVAKSLEEGTKSKKEIKLNGFPGLEIVREFEQGGTKLYMKMRMFRVKDRLYQVFVMSEQSKKDKADADKFLESFRLSEKAEEKKDLDK